MRAVKAQHHPKEAARLVALRRYDVLDTVRESDYDDIVKLASRICNAPIAVINLIDAERQWFKAEIGLGVRETPLKTSLCAHAILEDRFVEIPDTLLDPRMRDNPLCLDDPGLRFYAGALLITPDNYPIGALCVLDFQPRVLDEFQREALRTLAAQVMAQIELRAIIAREAMLRKEIDHRVKNSLQAVSAFVSLEHSVAQNDEARVVLLSVAQQIDTVAVLHEFLGESREGTVVDLAGYLSRIIMLIDAATPAKVHVTGTFENCPVASQTASVVGTIVNELVANSVKHSFADASGTITLSGTLSSTSEYRLICRDDGVATAKRREPDARKRLGLAIIEASVQQLVGTMRATPSDSGYRTQLDFPVEAVRKDAVLET